MAYCPADCVDTELLPNIPNCEELTRNDNIDRFGFFTCDSTLPSPLTCVGLQALVDTNKLAFTSALGGIDPQDPNFAEVTISDCRPAVEIATSRTYAFMDKVAIDRPADSGVSPAVVAEPYYNQRFWADKLNNQQSLRYLIIYCSGKVVEGKDENGNFLPATIRAFIKQENIGNAASPKYIQYIQGQIIFKGDPQAVANLPEENSNHTNFDITTCDLY